MRHQTSTATSRTKIDFSVTYYEGGRPCQYYPDFIVVTGEGAAEEWWVVETKGEIWPNTDLKRQAAEKWCRMMTSAGEGPWEYVFVHQPAFERAKKSEKTSFAQLLEALGKREPATPALIIISDEDAPQEERFSFSYRCTRSRRPLGTSATAMRLKRKDGSKLVVHPGQ